jgi:hypothetical protein
MEKGSALRPPPAALVPERPQAEADRPPSFMRIGTKKPSAPQSAGPRLRRAAEGGTSDNWNRNRMLGEYVDQMKGTANRKTRPRTPDRFESFSSPVGE